MKIFSIKSNFHKNYHEIIKKLKTKFATLPYKIRFLDVFLQKVTSKMINKMQIFNIKSLISTKMIKK